MLGTMMQFPLTLASVLDRAGKLFGSVEVVSRMPDRTIHRTNYAQVRSRALALASALAAAGIQSGDRVATLMWNHAWHLEAYFGIPLSGGVVHTLNPRLHADELSFIINHAADRILILDEVLLPLYLSVRDKVRLERVIVVPGLGSAPAGVETYENFLKQGSATDQPRPADENAAAAMCYTSGTTGAPKGVVYSHRSLVLHSLAVCLPDTFCLSQSDCLLPAVPMFHANAWGTPYAAAMVGLKLVMPGPHLDARSLLDLLAQEQVTRAAGVPTVWLAIRDLLEQNPGTWKLHPGLKVYIGGQAVPEAMIRAFDRLGIQVVHAWGMTELSPLGAVSNLKAHMASWPDQQRYAARARQGIPVPFVEVRAATPAGEAPWDDETLGELEVRGPWVAASYYNLPDAQERWTADGWFRTGDVVSIDVEGYIRIADRTKDLIKSGGEWISSIDIENALMGHPAVREAAVVAIPNLKWGERPLAAVVLKEGCQCAPEELQAHLAGRFSKWQLPEAIVFLDEIPRTSVGKFKKSRLREMYADWEQKGQAGGA